MGWFDDTGDTGWNFSQDTPQPAPTPMPDNINWSNVFGQVGDAMAAGVNYNYNQNPDPVYQELPPFSTTGFADDREHPYDPIGTWGSNPVSGAQYDELGGKQSQFYNPQQYSYKQIDPGFSRWQLKVDLPGELGTYAEPPIAALQPQYPDYPPINDERYKQTWQYMMGNNVWNGFDDRLYHYQPPLGPSW